MPFYRRTRSAYRTDPGTGQKSRATSIFDPFGGDTVTQQVASLIPNPTGFFKVAQSVAVDGVFYPFNGTAATSTQCTFAASAAVSATTVRLALSAVAVGASPPDPMGLALVFTGPTNNKGQMRLIKGWTGGVSTNRDVDLVDIEGGTRPLPDAVATTDTYEIGVPILWDTDVLIKTEFSASLASAPSAEVRLWFCDLAQKPDGTVRGGIWTPDVSLLTVMNVGRRATADGVVAVPTEESGYYHGGQLFVRAKGLTVVKVEHVTKPGAGVMSTWLAST